MYKRVFGKAQEHGCTVGKDRRAAKYKSEKLVPRSGLEYF